MRSRDHFSSSCVLNAYVESSHLLMNLVSDLVALGTVMSVLASGCWGCRVVITTATRDLLSIPSLYKQGRYSWYMGSRYSSP